MDTRQMAEKGDGPVDASLHEEQRTECLFWSAGVSRGKKGQATSAVNCKDVGTGLKVSQTI